MQCNTVQYIVEQWSRAHAALPPVKRSRCSGALMASWPQAIPTALYCTVPTALYCTVPTALYCTVPTALYCTVPTALYCALLYCIVLYFTVLYILHSTKLYVLHSTELYCIRIRTRGGIYGQIYPFEGNPEDKGVYLTVYTDSNSNTDSILF